MTLLEIIVLVGIGGIFVLNVAITVCGIWLWESVRKILNHLESED